MHRVAHSNEVMRWPEFNALAERLGVSTDHLKSLTIKLDDAGVHIVEERLGMDTSGQAERYYLD